MNQWTFVDLNILFDILKQCQPLNRITLDQRKSDYDHRMIQLTDVFCILLIFDYNKRLFVCSFDIFT
jgi:hypothetical protein